MAHETITIDAAETLIASAFSAIGVSKAAAASVAKALVAAEAEGQVGHGFSRVSDYAAQVRTGKVNGQAIPKLTETSASAFLINAGNGFAYPALDLAIEAGTDRAMENGIASMSISHSHHCGALSVQVDKIAQAGCIGLMVANAPAAMAPWGAKTAVFGTNPIAFSAPRAGRSPLIIDLSLSRVARGKVMHANKSGTRIPEGWALDKEGQPTTDPAAALEGTMVPIGEAKGTALALIVEILASALTGANQSSDVASFFTADGPPCGAGQFLLAIRPSDGGFGDRLEAILGLIEGAEGARLPGERRALAIRQSLQDGLKVPAHYLQAVRELAGSRIS